MKKIIALFIVGLLAGGTVFAQHCGNCPHHRQAAQQCQQPKVNADGIDMTVVKAFPTVKSVKKTDKWTEVYNAQKQLLGYALYSKPASDGIKGFNGETPVMITFNAKQVITGVYMLPNEETQNFAQRVVDAGLFNQWNGLTVKQAKKKKVDTVSGATFTSSAVIKSVKAALETL